MIKHLFPGNPLMMFARTSAAVALAALSLPALGCLEEPTLTASSLSQNSLSQNSLNQNALSLNALTANALTANALTANALTANALTANALTANALTAGALEDPLSRELLKYIVSCALPDDAEIDLTVDGIDYAFSGGTGLAPAWGQPDGSCGKSCRRWVSACVLARVDYLGVSLPISIRGARRQLASTAAERSAFPHREATYFGDIFASPQVRRACLSPGQTEIPRVCGPSLDGCVMDVIGSCDEVCDGTRRDGAFTGCGSDGDGDAADITVFLP
jgi:hypothetical protein